MSNGQNSEKNAQELFSSWFGTPATEIDDASNIPRKSIADLPEITTDFFVNKTNKHTINIEDNDVDINKHKEHTKNRVKQDTMTYEQKSTSPNRRKLEKHELETSPSDVSVDISRPQQQKAVIEPLHKEVKSVDIAISGSTYNVNCYADETDDLHKAVDYINNFVRDLRKDAPTLEHENLLVLCCLNMFEEMKQEEKHRLHLQELNKKAYTLIDKINNDVDSILP